MTPASACTGRWASSRWAPTGASATRPGAGTTSRGRSGRSRLPPTRRANYRDRHMQLRTIGIVESPLTDRAAAPKQGDEGAPDAWLAFDESVAEGLQGITAGDELLVFTWLDRARRDVLRVYPRGEVSRGEHGVFTTRSPDRPN